MAIKKLWGHLPREISRPMEFYLARGAKISSVKYRRSPLLQGGLELSCLVLVSIPPTVLNEKLIDRYMPLVQSSYVEPPLEAEVGSFESENNSSVQFSIGPACSAKRSKNENLKRKPQVNRAPDKNDVPVKKNVAQSKDIRVLFTNVEKSHKASTKLKNQL